MKNRMALTLLVMLLLTLEGYGEEVWDLETFPFQRTQQYSAGPYEHIVVFSPSRTGSSLVYNVMRFLFEDEDKLSSRHDDFDLNRRVLKTHRFVDVETLEGGNDLFAYTFRNPIEASISCFRVLNLRKISLKRQARDLIDRYVNHLTYSERTEQGGKTFLRLYFEDFNDNPDFLFETIESYFSITIATADKELIKAGYSKESIASNIENFQDFRNYLPVSGFHGNHVDLSGFQPPEELLYWLDIYLEDAKPLFQKYGYFLEETPTQD